MSRCKQPETGPQNGAYAHYKRHRQEQNTLFRQRSRVGLLHVYRAKTLGLGR